MNEQIGKVIVGSMLRKSRETNGYAQRDVAITLGLANPNYLSMIEKGTHTIPIKRLWDFINAYRLSKTHGLAVIKMTNEDIWTTIIMGVEACMASKAKVEELKTKVDEIIEAEASEAGVTLN